MWVDSNHSWLQTVRYQLGFIVAPTQALAQLPNVLYNWFEESSANQQQLLIENKQLTARNLVLELKMQRLSALEAENVNLRELLNASEQIDDRVLVTSVIALDPDPFSQQVLINKGGEDGVFIGQPVLDAYGLLGQVIDVLPYSALVMMIADANHAIPVQVNRNGVRSIALESKVSDTNTFKRLEALVERGVLQKELAENLSEALSYFVQVRLQQQIERYNPDTTEFDEAPNEINIKLLTALERQLLRDALSVVKDFKKYLIQRYHLVY